MKRQATLVILTILATLILGPAVAHAAPSEFEELRSKGLFFAYLGVFAAGFLTSLTPCVYPMITITVGIFGAREATSRWRAFGLAWAYVLGMVVMFSLLGVLFALSGRASGSGFLLANPAIVIPIVILYVVLAASMFGVFELNLPSGLATRLSSVGGKGTAGAFLMGLVGGITAAPCTGPMLAGLLAFIATTRSVPLGITFMSTYAIGMGVLFLVIATFALRLPKSGAWMDLVKAIGGIALLAVGFYFLRPIVPVLTRLTSTSTLFLVAAIAAAVIGFAAIWGYMRNRKIALKAGGIALVTVGAMMAINFTLTPRAPLAWRSDQKEALAEAKAAGKPALLDFAAGWCVPCKAFETDILSDPAVHDEVASRYVPVKFDVTQDTEADQANKETWNAATLPTVILVASDGREVRRFTGELPSRDVFLSAIRKVQ
jgi:thiol:disulfide interchange protein DsbD